MNPPIEAISANSMDKKPMGIPLLFQFDSLEIAGHNMNDNTYTCIMPFLRRFPSSMSRFCVWYSSWDEEGGVDSEDMFRYRKSF